MADVEHEKNHEVIVIGTMTISGCTVTGNGAPLDTDLTEGGGFYNASSS